jgi:peptidyl-prolyl cis-trans isomerase A (cyclophilin A)
VSKDAPMQYRSLFAVAAACALLGAGPRAPKPVDVAIETSVGTIVVRVETAKAPLTSANFLRYVDTHKYDGSSFYRTVRPVFGQPIPHIQVIQGGLEQTPGAKPFAPIPLETTQRTGLHNVEGTLAMARTSEPNSATAEFFINAADDRWLDSDRFADHEGYAVFAKVIRGRDVAEKIHSAPASGETLVPAIRIIRMRRV